MASFFPASLENLIDGFASLPGIGRKSAQRLAFYILSLPEGEAEAFARSVLENDSLRNCPHGRPCVAYVSRYQLEKLFKRVL